MKLKKDSTPFGNKLKEAEIDINRIISRDSLIFPFLQKLVIPNFRKENVHTYTLTISETPTEILFKDFVETILKKKGLEYYPVIRFSDGEYEFLVGKKPSLFDGKITYFAKHYLFYCYELAFKNKNFEAKTLPGVSSGSYRKSEVRMVREQLIKNLRILSKRGIFALHLTYSKIQFQEKYHKHLFQYFRSNNVIINSKNYIPFYFVYALIMGPYGDQLFSNSKLLLIHSATGNKKDKIEKSLYARGVKSIQWITISNNRSLFENINLDGVKDIDYCLFGAGVGKINLITQLVDLNVPTIDAGYCFEVWANNENKFKRPMMIRD